jgi:lipoic acid synthetase
MFAEAIKEIRDRLPEATEETLVPDFAGSVVALQKVIAARPNIFNHNVETVPRLYPEVRPGADWNRSLRILETAAVNGLITKSGMMLGMGEKQDEVLAALEELRSVCCKIITLGQYLAPSRKHRPVARYLELAEFEYWRDQGLEMGFKEVFSAPLVRSSYHADSLCC